jgi:pyruvate/2-oxoglutarate dehydrogenase complex dihydrolipoamide dehydrogenase (E3) component
MVPDQYDLVIVGMRSAGMVAAEFAATLQLRVAVVERARIGGASQWSGGVPSKALAAAARVAHTVRRAHSFGIATGEVQIDLPRVWQRIRDVRADIAGAADDEARAAELGIEIRRGEVQLTGPHEVTVHDADGEHVLPTRFVLLCTGSTPAIPDLPGLATAADAHPHLVLTDETLFELGEPPRSVVVLGGGQTGVETAQALARLGVTTTLVEQSAGLLQGEEPSLAARLGEILVDDGVRVLTGTRAVEAWPTGGATPDGIAVRVIGRDGTADHEQVLDAEAVFLATGRRPVIDGLGLDAVGLEVTVDGVVVDERSRTVYRSVYAVGDVTATERVAHSGEHAALRAVRDMFFPGRAAPVDVVPWCTFTDPELAHAGLTSGEAEALLGDEVDVWRIELADNDRTRIEGAAPGAIVVVTARDRIVGAHVLGLGAGELVHELALAIDRRLGLADLAALAHVHPTTATSVGMLAAESLSEKAQRYRWLVRRR